MNNISSHLQISLYTYLYGQLGTPDETVSPANLSSLVGKDLASSLVIFGKAILVILVGWIVAALAKGIVHKLLQRTQIDNRVASWISGSRDGSEILVENWIAEAVYWVILIFAIVAFLNTLQLDAVSEPLNALLTQITSFLPKIFGAGILLGVAWLLATLTRTIVSQVLLQSRIEQRLGLETEETPSQQSLAETISNALYWFVFLLFFPSILSILQLQGTLVPIQALLDEILSILPNVLAAVLIGAVGWVFAQIVRRVVTNLSATLGIDRIGAKMGLAGGDRMQSLSQILGLIVYVLILIPVAITALDALEIQAISAPATAMLNQALSIVPKLFSASVILAVAYVAARYVSELVTQILSSLGFDDVLVWIGLSNVSLKPIETAPSDSENPSLVKTPSQWIGTIAAIAIMLVASLTAVDILEIASLRTVLGVILQVSAQVLVGVVIFSVGLYLANLAFRLILSSGSPQAFLIAQAARIAITVFVAAMALQQMGIAPNIVNLAFGLLTGGIAVAIALAFGLGGRDVAGEQLRHWLQQFKNADRAAKDSTQHSGDSAGE